MHPILLYSHIYGPNPWKVAIILEELQLPYETKFIDFADVKKEPYTTINPNGRLPSITDPNQNITLWESSAIIEYLLETYDLDNRLSYTSLVEKYHCRTWLFFQASGQAPYYGQAGWFVRSHPEHVPSAIERYINEVRRVTGVLDSVLQSRSWLVGDRCTYVDLCFVPWQEWAPVFGGEDLYDEFPLVKRWMEEMKARPAVRKVLEDQKRALEQSGDRTWKKD